MNSGSADSVVESRIEWHGVGRLVMSGLVTLHVPCLVDGSGHGHMIKEVMAVLQQTSKAVRTQVSVVLIPNAGTARTLGYGETISDCKPWDLGGGGAYEGEPPSTWDRILDHCRWVRYACGWRMTCFAVLVGWVLTGGGASSIWMAVISDVAIAAC